MIKTCKLGAPWVCAAVTLLIVCLPTTVLAEKLRIRGWYVGTGYALTNVFATAEGSMSSERGSSDSGFIINGGYRFNRYLAAEISYLNGGEPSFENTLLRTGEAAEVVDVSVSQKLDAFEASGLAILPFWRICEIYFRLGAAFWMADSEQIISLEGSEPYARQVDGSGVDLLMGVGAGVTPWKNLHLRPGSTGFQDQRRLARAGYRDSL